MKVPQTPPRLDQLIPKIGFERFQELLGMPPLYQGRYLHWDEIRHRQPPEGLDHEGWWAGIKMARQAMLRALPLVDKQGRSVQFSALCRISPNACALPVTILERSP